MSGATTTNPFGVFFRSGFAGLPPGTYVGGYIPTGANPGDTNAFQPPDGTVYPSGAFTQTTVGATGSAGNIKIETGQLSIKDGAAIATTTFGQNSNAGNISVQAHDSISVANGSILSGVAGGAIGNSGNIDLSTRSLAITGGGTVQTQTLGQGIAGNIEVNATDAVTISGTDSTSLTPSGLRSGSGGSNTQLGTASNNIGQGGDISVTTGNLSLADGGVLDAQTLTNSRGGNITVNATQSLYINQASLLARSNGAAPAGSVTINSPNVTATNGTIATSSELSSGGDITITADKIRLYGNSDITTFVAQGAGGGGDIKLTADSILAFDDSDILAFAPGGTGGNITLETPAFFGENYRPASRNTDPRTLDHNNRVDVNATGTLSSGVITLPDTTFIQNSLTELPENQIDTDSLLANSCIVRRNQPTQGSFTITGSGGLPQRPGDAQMSTFPTVDIETLPSDNTSSTTNPNRPWQKGDPIVEPQGVYRLPNGKLIMSRECSRIQ
jgi:large exoprotein involved in heme utilization and adhesion